MIDLRSDTVTKPTRSMLEAMAAAEVGDDVFREDPTVARLQERAAELFEREAALFVPSGTMGNQIAVKLHTRPGQEVVIEARGHIYNWEMAMMAAFSGCVARPVEAPRGQLSWSLIEPQLGPPVYYRARTGLIALENTHNMAGGTLMSGAELEVIVAECRNRELPIHLDGARIFNASAAASQPVARLAAGCDSVMFCLSKGLAAPVGSLLVGDADFIEEAWSVRKMLGGGMRQVGVLAAAGLVALDEMPARLADDHARARRLGEALQELDEFSLDPDALQTNIVIADLNSRTPSEVLQALASEKVLAVSTGPGQLRFVTHKDVSSEQIEQVIAIVRRLFG